MKRVTFCIALSLLVMTAVSPARSGDPSGFRGDFLGTIQLYREESPGSRE